MNYNRKKDINDKIKLIHNKEYFTFIWNIIKDDLYFNNGIKKFTQNNNGIFFDLNNISESNLIKLESYLNNNVKKI